MTDRMDSQNTSPGAIQETAGDAAGEAARQVTGGAIGAGRLLSPAILLGLMTLGGTAVAVPIAVSATGASSFSAYLSMLLALLGLTLGGLVLHRSNQLRRVLVEADMRLLDSESRYSAAAADSEHLRGLLLDAVDSISEGFVLFDAEGRLVACNDRYREIYPTVADILVPGITFEEILFAAAERLGVTNDIESQKGLRHWIETRLNRHLTADGPVEAHLSDGRWYRISERPTRAGGIVKVLMDITDARSHAAALAAKTEILETTFEAMAQGVCVFDADLTLASWNHTFAVLTGYPDDLLKPGTPLNAFLAVDVARGVAALPAADTPGADMPIPVALPSGHILETQHSTLPRGGFVATFTDITTRRQTEVALQHSQKMDAIGQLAGGVAHEFNNMLTSIGGFAHLARRNPGDSARVVTCLDQITKASDRAAQLTSQLLDFSRRSDRDSRAPVHLKTLTRDLTNFLYPLLGERVDVRVAVHDPALVVEADQAKLTQAIVNLCINARDAMLNAPDGGDQADLGGTITIDVDAFDADAPFLAGHANVTTPRLARLSVTDTGTGIAADILPRIFEPFFTTKEQGKGTGLGLPMVYSTAEQLGGAVTVDSQPGVGSTFSLFLPRADHGDVADPVVGEDARIDGAGRMVLVAEDEDTVRDLISMTLQEAGYSVVTACDGAEAAALFEFHGEDFAALVSDVVMPRMDGPALARRLLDRVPDLKVVLLSGYDAKDAAAAMAALPGCRFLRKPVVPDALVTALGGLLSEDGDDELDYLP